MNPVYQEYLAYLDELGDVLEQLTQVARTKTIAAHNGDMEQLDQCMKQEQAFSMSLRSMDHRRDQMLAEMGLEDVVLSQLAGRYPQELRSQAAQTAERALNRYDEYVAASNAAMTSLECVLRDIEHMMPDNQPKPETPPDAPPPRMKTDFRA